MSLSERNLAIEVKEALEIDETNILEELRRHSSKYFYYGVLWARAAKEQRKVHLRLKALEASLMKELRMKVAETGDPKAKVTSEMKSEYLSLSPEYQVMYEKEINATYMEEVLSVARDGMRQRGHALQELARQLRSEGGYGDEMKRIREEYEERIEDKRKQRSDRVPKEEE